MADRTLMYEYKSYIKPQLEEAISNALANEAGDVLIDCIENSAITNVYAKYSPHTGYVAKGSMVLDETYTREVNGLSITITANVPGRNIEVSDIIEAGSGWGWDIAGVPARPWMLEGAELAVNGGSFERAIEAGLRRQGF